MTSPVRGPNYPQKRRVAILTAASLSRNPRAFKEAESLARAGFVTGASHRNWTSCRESIALPDGIEDWRPLLLTDPQTSGGLLVACDASAAPAILARIREGDPRAALVGRAERGGPLVVVE